MKLVPNINRKKAQGMTEYIIIIILVAIALIAIVRIFGGEINKQFKSGSDEIKNLN